MPTIHEVARAAGVSISTVSYALSGKRPVATATRQRIEAAVAQLGYQPNAGARMLAGRRTQIFALTEPLRADTHTPTHMAFVLATAVAARRRDYDLLLLTDAEASAGMRRVAASDLVDAILVLDVAPDDDRVAIARSVDIPTIFVGIPDDHDGLHCVDLDFEAAAALAVDRIADAGHTRYALIGQTEVSYRFSNFPARVRRGTEARADARGLTGTFTASGASTLDPEVVRTAVAAALANGTTAFLLHGPGDQHEVVLAALAEHGRRVGEDVAVVSIAASFSPAELSRPIDTIPLVAATSCDLAVDLAVRCLSDSPPAPTLHLLAPTYLDAGSVAPPTSP